MRNDYLSKAENLALKARNRRRCRIVAAVLSLALFSSVSLSFLKPASAQAGVVYCGYVEHVHTDECFEESVSLICTLAESGHVHTDACWEDRPVLTCNIKESDGHTHSEACLGPVKVLTCPLAEWDGHVHSAECYNEDGALICGMETGQGAHHHSGECFTEETGYVCGLEESAGHHHSESCFSYEHVRVCGYDDNGCHTHTDSCYSTEKTAICGNVEHVHTLQCYSNPSADLESAAIWERTVKDVELTDNPGENVVKIALSQLGYRESAVNFTVLEDGVAQHGVTRYGQWFGIPYGDWCAMFVSFCLNYAGIEEAWFPRSSGCIPWVEQFRTLERFEDSSEYTPGAGDIVFFDWDGDKYSDHVGIVEYFDDEKDVVHTIEGNCGNAVRQCEYEQSSPELLGYGRMLTADEFRILKASPVASGVMKSAGFSVNSTAPVTSAKSSGYSKSYSSVRKTGSTGKSTATDYSELPPVKVMDITPAVEHTEAAALPETSVSGEAPAVFSVSEASVVPASSDAPAAPAVESISEAPAVPTVETTSIAPAVPASYIPPAAPAVNEDPVVYASDIPPVISTVEENPGSLAETAPKLPATPVPAEIAYTIYPKGVYTIPGSATIGALPVASTGGLCLLLAAILLIMKKQDMI